ncbi:MAG: GAF domain-containing protein, partial [Acidobacteria bacterium]|nr:GAF domain-containing protein [Acidobacteriota bacterium]
SPLSSALAVPLEFLDEPAGVMSLYRTDRDAFSAAELSLLQAVAQRVGRAWPSSLTLVSTSQEFPVDASTLGLSSPQASD